MEKRYWFKSKRYGYGWYPATWEGWAATAGYLVFNLAGTIPFAMNPHSYYAWSFWIAYQILITVTLIAVCQKTGEKAHWRWGGD